MSGWILLAALRAAPATAQLHHSRQIDALGQACEPFAMAGSRPTAEAADPLTAMPTNGRYGVFAGMGRGTC